MKVTALIVSEAVATTLCSGVAGFVPCFSGIRKIGTIKDISVWVDPILKPTSILVNHVYEEGDERPSREDYERDFKARFGEDVVLL